MADGRQELRPVQQRCVQLAVTKNLILSLPTGAGKTLVAARVIEHFLERHPKLLAVFLVPTQSLVDQQANYCRAQIRIAGSETRVLKIVGNEQAAWTLSDWKVALDFNHIFLGTPAVLYKALVTNSYLSLNDFSVVVFDECHNVKGRAPMAMVMRDAVHPHTRTSNLETPRILGLTASFANGATSNLEKDRRDLEELLHATMHCPPIEERLTAANFTRVTYNKEDNFHTFQHESLIKSILEQSLSRLGRFKDLKKTLSQCSHVFAELGRQGLMYYLEHAIVQQIKRKIASLEGSLDENAIRQVKSLKKGLPLLVAEVGLVTSRLSVAFDEGESAPPRTPKLQALLDLLEQNFSENSGSSTYRGIVFVEQISLVATMAKTTNDFFHHKSLPVRCGVVAGCSAQPRAERSDNLESFRTGEVRILVATAACEEGLDVPQCQFSIMYSEIKTSKSHTQRSGRVRHHSAELYYFENDPNSEIRKAAKIRCVAGDSSLALSADELNLASANICASGVVSDKHPYPSNCRSGEVAIVSVNNCKDIFLQYCSSSLGRSFNISDRLYEYDAADDTSKEVLVSVNYPTPSGWNSVKEKEIHEFWAGEDLMRIFPKGKSESERLELLFLYVAVRKLREERLLDCHNKTLDKHKSPTKLACALQTSSIPKGILLKQSVVLARSIQSNPDQARKQLSHPNAGITLENCREILERFLGSIFESNASFDSHLFFQYASRPDDNGWPQVIPTVLVFPTPSGWSEMTERDLREAFDGMDLSDQVPPSWSEQQTMEAAFAYLAANELHGLGYLDGSYQPSLTPAALERTRRKCSVSELTANFLRPSHATPPPCSSFSMSTTISDPSDLQIGIGGQGAVDIEGSLAAVARGFNGNMTTISEVSGPSGFHFFKTDTEAPPRLNVSSTLNTTAEGGFSVNEVQHQSLDLLDDDTMTKSSKAKALTDAEGDMYADDDDMNTNMNETIPVERSEVLATPPSLNQRDSMSLASSNYAQSNDNYSMADTEAHSTSVGGSSLLPRMVSGSSSSSIGQMSEMIGPVVDLGGQFDDCDDEMSL